jgi:hypothetical protein
MENSGRLKMSADNAISFLVMMLTSFAVGLLLMADTTQGWQMFGGV